MPSQVVRLRRVRLFLDGVDVLLAREIVFLLVAINEREGLMAAHRVAFPDLSGLLERFLFIAAHESGRDHVELDETPARVEIVRIELDCAREFAMRLRGEAGLFEDVGLLRERPIRLSEQKMRLGIVRILVDGLLEQIRRGLIVIPLHRGAALIEERSLPERHWNEACEGQQSG